MRMALELRVPVRRSRQTGVRLPSTACREVPARRRASPAEAPRLDRTARSTALPVRLRVLLGLAACGLGVHWFVPRALAYWQLHGAATEFANYAACMVGSAGPELLWQRPGEFWRLVRRRLVASPAGSRPFAGCVPSADAFAEGPARRPAHLAPVEDFREYAAVAAAAAPRFALADLIVTNARLEQLAESSGPLLTKTLRELVRPSLRARVAPAPAELPLPARGWGLPAANLGYASLKELETGYLLSTGRDANLAAYWSEDGGKVWSAPPVDDVDGDQGHCSVAGSMTRFRLSAVGDGLHLESWERGELGSSVPLAAAQQRLLAFSCDAQAAVAVLADEARRHAATFRLCPRLARCRDLSVPAELAGEPNPSLELSAARVRGATILAASRGGIVRVVSSRDDGQTWTPPVVAYDAAEYPDASRAQATPSRLLALGSRVLLYAGADHPGASYPALVSDNLGASWRSP